jgi:hypothetical protein
LARSSLCWVVLQSLRPSSRASERLSPNRHGKCRRGDELGIGGNVQESTRKLRSRMATDGAAVRVVVRGLVEKTEFNNHVAYVQASALMRGENRVPVTIAGTECGTFIFFLHLLLKLRQAKNVICSARAIGMGLPCGQRATCTMPCEPRPCPPSCL